MSRSFCLYAFCFVLFHNELAKAHMLYLGYAQITNIYICWSGHFKYRRIDETIIVARKMIKLQLYTKEAMIFSR